MEDEVLTAKKCLREHYSSNATFQPVPEKTSEASDIDIAVAAGLPPTALQFGFGLDLANSISNWKRGQRFKRIRKSHPDRPVLVAEGDSWFLHPLVPDIIDHLSGKYAISSYAAAGDTFEGMLKQSQVERALSDTGTSVLLLSAGGNDLLGDRFGSWLSPFDNVNEISNTRRFLNKDYADMMVDIAEKYRDYVKGLLLLHRDLQIIVHGYDYVVPRYEKKGKWLGTPLYDKGFREPEDGIRMGILKEIVNDFYGMLEDLAGQEWVEGRLSVVNGRNVVKNWYDEIHPDEENSRRVAELFDREITRALARSN